MTTKRRIAILSAALIAAGSYYFINNSGREEIPVLAELPVNIEETEISAFPEQVFVQIDPKELDCMQKNIYYEAGEEDMAGKEQIALVVFKRMSVTNTRTYPKDVCGVVYQRKHFSWTNSPKRMANLKNPIERRAWEDSRIAAEKALRGELVDTVGATHYYSTKAMKRAPYWVRANDRMVFVKQIGNHAFYIDSKLKFGA
jgi:spore germination cell wall hydrolase CwlJ-like protein